MNLNDRNRIFAGAGWVPSFYLYRYTATHYDNNGVALIEENESNKSRITLNHAEVITGYERQVATRFRWQIAMYYGSVGYYNFASYRYAGLRTSFWLEL